MMPYYNNVHPLYGTILPDPYKGVGEYVGKLKATQYYIDEVKQYLEKYLNPIRASAQYARDKQKITNDYGWNKICQIEQQFFLKTIESHELHKS